jgi:cell division protein FtsB
MSENERRKNSIILVILLCVLYFVSWVFVYQWYFIPAFSETQKNRIMVSKLQQEIQLLKKENEHLKARIEALVNNDPTAWEDATRKYLGWVKPGEIIIETGE